MPTLEDLVGPLLPGDGPLIVACSGGADSLALLLLAHTLSSQVEAAHFDHLLRPDSALDAQFVADLCHRLRIPFHLHRRAVAEVALQTGLSLEAAARQARYSWLHQLARQRGGRVVTAHTLEDQAETVLMRCLSGASLASLGGIRPHRGEWLCRPLLSVPRAELRAYLVDQGQDWREDPTNQDLGRPRNWVRRVLLPVILEAYPRAPQALSRLAEAAREDEKALQVQVRRLPRDSRVADLCRWPRPILWRFLRRQWARLAPPGARLGRVHLVGLEELIRGPRGGSCPLPGKVLVERLGGRLHWGRLGREAPEELCIALAPRMELKGWGLTLEMGPGGVSLDPDRVLGDGCLRLRAWKPGDRLGRHKLKDLWGPWGVPRSRRLSIPILVDRQDRPVWVVGFGHDSSCQGPLALRLAEDQVPSHAKAGP